MQLTALVLSLALSASALPVPSFLVARQNSISGKTISLLPLGDSITWGYPNPTTGYRSPLYNSLAALSPESLDFVGSVQAGTMKDPDNEGHPGYTIAQIASAASAIKSRYKPNVIILHAGTNDANGSADPSQAGNNLGKLIDQVISQWPNAALLVARIIPSTNSNTQRNIDTLNSQINTLVSNRANQGKHIAVVDMSKGKINTSDLSDSLHPTQAGYAKMANLWLAGIKTAAGKGWF
nr:hypothetical protein B0A51_01501 [Rachicladosporium sp. CCFEE 5018]